MGAAATTGLARVYPLDVGALCKGDYIPESEIVRIVGGTVGTAKFEFGRLKLRDHIEEASADLGAPVQVRVEGDGLRVLTDAEAVARNEQDRRGVVRKLGRTLRRQCRVDRSQLGVEDLRTHERSVLILGQSAQALRRIGRTPMVTLREQAREKLPDLRSSRGGDE